MFRVLAAMLLGVLVLLTAPLLPLGATGPMSGRTADGIAEVSPLGFGSFAVAAPATESGTGHPVLGKNGADPRPLPEADTADPVPAPRPADTGERVATEALGVLSTSDHTPPSPGRDPPATTRSFA